MGLPLLLYPFQNPIPVPLATDIADGAMSSEDKVKLDNLSLGDVFVFRPGGVDEGNVFTDWATLMVACDAQSNFLRTIEFDDSIVSPCVIPAGTWNMDEVFWTGTLNAIIPMVAVQVVEGAIFTKLRRIGGALAVEFTGSTPPVTDFTSGQADGVSLSQGVRLTCTGTGPFVRNSIPGALALITLADNATINTGATPAVDIAVAGASTIVVGFTAGTIQANTLSSAVGTSITLLVLASSAFFEQTQTAVLGTLINSNQSRQRLNPSDVVTTADSPYSASNNELVRCDLPSGNITVVLPPASNAKGMWVVVKNLASTPEISNIAVSPSPGDTVDGSGAAIFNTPRQSVTYVSDGISDWLQI